MQHAAHTSPLMMDTWLLFIVRSLRLLVNRRGGFVASCGVINFLFIATAHALMLDVRPAHQGLSTPPANRFQLVKLDSEAELQTAHKDYSRFSHTTQSHAAMSCNACHQRIDNRLVPTLSAHRDCTGCHLPQFVTPNVALCSICHTNLDTANPPVKPFPSIKSFNVAFDHAQHNTGAARPREGCTACHTPLNRGIARSIPARFDGANGGHTACYTCHTANSSFNGRDLASCGTCHTAAKFYRRTPTTARAFDINFSHADHSARQNLSCNACHSLHPKAAQSRQVSSPLAEMHKPYIRAPNCMTCHNDRPTFGDRDFANCRRCHTGSTFNIGE